MVSTHKMSQSTTGTQVYGYIYVAKDACLSSWTGMGSRVSRGNKSSDLFVKKNLHVCQAEQGAQVHDAGQ